MASSSYHLASVHDVPTTKRFSSRRLQSFRCPGSAAEGDNSRLRPFEETSERMEVLLPTFENVEEQSGGARESKTLLVSATGQCSTKPNNLAAKQRHGPAEFRDDVQPNTPHNNNDINIMDQRVYYGGGDVAGLTPAAANKLLSSSKLYLSSFSKMVRGRLGHTPTKGKRIAVTEDVLATYHESFLYGQVDLSTKVRTSFRGPVLSRTFLVLECIAGLLLLGLYVRTTYTDHQSHWITIVQLSCSFFFLVDYLIKLYSTPVRLYYAFSPNGIVDLISTLPIYFILSGVMADAAIPQVILVFRVLRAVPWLSSWALPGGAVGQEIFLMTAYCLGIFVLAAGVLQWVEWRATSKAEREANGCPAYGCLSFYDAFYFVIVTVFTVGYGDITLKSEWGRAVTILIIIAAVVFIPVEINKILDLAARRPYGGKYAVRKVLGSRFIIVSGNLSYRAVEDFLSEIYHPSHAEDMRTFPLRMVILAPFKPSFEMKALLTQYKGRVEFIEGTPLKDSDLERVSANIASAFFLMADHLAQDHVAEDAAQMTRALSVYRYCGSKVRLIVEMLKPENQDNPIWDDVDGGIEIVCPEAIRYQLLARSCQVKGISTFVINLFKAGLDLRDPRILGGHGGWMEKYCHGQQQEIYPVIFPPCFHQHGLTFEEAVEIVYTSFHIILFGLDISIDLASGSRDVILFPRQRVIQATDVGLVIAEDLAIAEKVSTYGGETLPAHYLNVCWRKIFFKPTPPPRNDAAATSQILDIMRRRQNENPLLREFLSATGSMSMSRRDRSQRQGSGMMSSGHRADLQMQLQEIVCASSSINAAAHGIQQQQQQQQQQQRDDDVLVEEEEEQQQKTKTEEKKKKKKKVYYSLEEAIDVITQWPPSKPERPDYPVLEKRAERIRNNLQERTLSLVSSTLPKPHVLVCIQGKWPDNLFCFVAHLRTTYSFSSSVVAHVAAAAAAAAAVSPPIVILHPHTPSVADWGCVGMFDDVYFISGSPLYEIDLVRAGVLQAEKVLVLSSTGGSSPPNNGIIKDITSSEDRDITDIDINNVLITATIERLLHPVQGRIMVELHQETEIHYLRPKLRINPHRFDSKLYKRNRSATFLFAPAFVEGRGFCSASLTFLLYALFFNRNTVKITEKLICGSSSTRTAEEEEVEMVVEGRLEQVALPKTYEGRSFQELLLGMLRQQHCLVLGIYRHSTTTTAVPFVYTNPPPSDILLPGDLVYVLQCT